MSKRREVNASLEKSVNSFLEVARLVMEGTRIINDANYDLRELTTEQAAEFLKITVDSTHTVKKNWISLRQTVDEVIFCIDWYINRCNMDLKRYREKLHGETRIIPRDEFDLPEWTD